MVKVNSGYAQGILANMRDLLEFIAVNLLTRMPKSSIIICYLKITQIPKSCLLLLF